MKIYKNIEELESKGCLTENAIVNSDCLEAMKYIPDRSIDLIVTDPPYKCTSHGGSGSMSGYWKEEKGKKGIIFDNNNISCKDYMPEFFRILKDRSICYIMCNHINLQEMINVSTEVGFKFVKCLIWEKGNKICGRYYMNCFEYILLLRKGGDKPINNCGTSDILRVPVKKSKDKNGKNLHDTEKPVELMRILIENSSKKNEIILDPFMGIGSTIIACKQCNRNGIGIELDKNYFNIARQRIENNTEQISIFDKEEQ